MAGDVYDTSNRGIADILHEMSGLYAMRDVPFKPQAYENAAMAVESAGRPVEEIYRSDGLKGLEAIDGVGKSIAAHIASMIDTGRFEEYEALRAETPVDVRALMAVEGVGPKGVRLLWEQLGVRTLEDLEAAALAGRLRDLPRFGEKKEERILKGIAFRKQSGGRFPLGAIYAEADSLVESIRTFPGVDRASVAGSLRRMKETIGDIDILVISSDPQDTMRRLIKLPPVIHVYGQGETKTNIRISGGVDVDVRVVPAESWGAALNYFTGSKAHNISLREKAVRKGWKLNEYGLFDKDDRQIAGRTEEDIYEKFGLSYVPPEMREDRGEIALAEKGKLPKLIDYGELRGDCQLHTTWSDGKNSLREMAEAAMERGLEYIAVTDHTASLAITKGLDAKRLRRQGKEIRKLNEEFGHEGKSFRILRGAEVNIMKDGSLDIEDEVLEELDLVGAAVHSYFDLPRADQTTRILRAMENRHVDVVFHPAGRLINRRSEIGADMEAVIAQARDTGTALEVDSQPDRLDLRDEYVRMCVDAGVRLFIDSDAHSKGQYDFLIFGIAQARRGWATRKDVLNCLPADRLLEHLSKRG